MDIPSRLLRYEVADELNNFVCCGIEREMARVDDMDFSHRHIAAMGLPFRKVEREVARCRKYSGKPPQSDGRSISDARSNSRRFSAHGM
jgi:hypothetical protein